ncbi:MAG: dimethylhistidine N-methyltransferase [Cellvibrionaceae bacterium]|jgi:dimethylhistidine N-methyltransferase
MPSSLQNVVDTNDLDDEFLDDVVVGLSKQQKTLPCKYFYDERGSQLFEKICETDEYYVTRTELELYRQYSDEMSILIGERALIIEPGAGSVRKIALLLSRLNKPSGFIPMDISAEILKESSQQLAEQFPHIDINPVVIDFLNEEKLCAVFSRLPKQPLVNKRVIFFPGSTIGNFHPDEAQFFLKRFSDNLESGDGLLIGVDLVKNTTVLESAYNDREGVTADFNLNLLHRINNELEGDFEINSFDHHAVFNNEKNRIEMHIVSTKEQQVKIANKRFNLLENESIHTENSYKYSVDTFSEVASGAGFKLKNTWKDKGELFSIHYLEKH